MAAPRQFDLVRIGGKPSVVLQDDMHEGLGSRVVAPLVPIREARHQPKGLCPAVTIEGEPLAVLLPSMAAVPRGALSPPFGALAEQRDLLLRGLDLLFTGV
jgi:toxin CcdB